MDDMFPSKIDEREKFILESVSKMNGVSFDWYELNIAEKNHTGKFWVMADALKINNIRVNVTAHTQQLIADLLECSLLTARLSDYIFRQAEIKITPRITPISMTTESMIEHSKEIDSEVLKHETVGKLISTVGKDWIIDSSMVNPRMPNQAVNYGWHFIGRSFDGINGNHNSSLMMDSKGLYIKVIQPISWHHNSSHVDRSQVCRLVMRDCMIDGIKSDIRKVMVDPNLCPLVSHNGPLKVLRQPGT